MSRRYLILGGLVVLGGARPAHAEVAAADVPATAAAVESPAAAVEDDLTAEIGDQGVGATLGVAIGGGLTPGGVHLTGHYLYQLSRTDWFDGTVAFTFGGGDAACFRDRRDDLVCDHGIADGGALEIAGGVRRMFARQGMFRPFARIAIGISYLRYGNDDVSGAAIPLHVGGGIRAQVASRVAVVGLGQVTIGLAQFGRGLGAEAQLGLAVTAGAEFKLP